MRNLNRKAVVYCGLVIVSATIAAAVQRRSHETGEGETFYCSAAWQQALLEGGGTASAPGQTLECHRDRRSETDLAVMVENRSKEPAK